MEKAGILAGLIGLLLLVVGVAAIYWPAGLIVAGLALLFWSAMVARSIAQARLLAPREGEGA